VGGHDQRDQRYREHLIRHHQQALARLGYQVTLIPPGDGGIALGQAVVAQAQAQSNQPGQLPGSRRS